MCLFLNMKACRHYLPIYIIGFSLTIKNITVPTTIKPQSCPRNAIGNINNGFSNCWCPSINTKMPKHTASCISHIQSQLKKNNPDFTGVILLNLLFINAINGKVCIIKNKPAIMNPIANNIGTINTLPITAKVILAPINKKLNMNQKSSVNNINQFSSCRCALFL